MFPFFGRWWMGGWPICLASIYLATLFITYDISVHKTSRTIRFSPSHKHLSWLDVDLPFDKHYTGNWTLQCTSLASDLTCAGEQCLRPPARWSWHAHLLMNINKRVYNIVPPPRRRVNINNKWISKYVSK